VRPNLLREGIAAGSLLVGVVPPFVSPEAVEFFGLLGFDWILLDGEHGPLGVETCQSLVRAADTVGLATVVRAPANEPWLILGYAETGADCVLVPHIVNAAEGERLARAVAYPPKGNRGAMSGSRAANYGLTQTSFDYFAAQRHALPMAMIEDIEALENLDALTAVPGLDTFLIGPGDLAMSMGLPGGFDSPAVREEVHRAARLLAGAGKTVGTVVSDADSAARAVEAGARLLAVGIGVVIAGATRGLLTSLRNLGS
jgi:2-keto-3-deoxy-L-rhamnonate aldolase RhmA